MRGSQKQIHITIARRIPISIIAFKQNEMYSDLQCREAHLLLEGTVWEGPRKSLCVTDSNRLLERQSANGTDCQFEAVLLLRHSKQRYSNQQQVWNSRNNNS